MITARTFRDGDDVIVLIPPELGFGIGVDVQIERRGDEILITPVDKLDESAPHDKDASV